MVVRYKENRDSFSNCFCAVEEDDSGEFVSYEAYAELEATIKAITEKWEPVWAAKSERESELEATIARQQEHLDTTVDVLEQTRTEKDALATLLDATLEQRGQKLEAAGWVVGDAEDFLDKNAT